MSQLEQYTANTPHCNRFIVCTVLQAMCCNTQSDMLIWGCRCNAACAPRLDMTVAEFAHWWKMHKAGQDDRLLYLKDWHFANEFPDYKAYQTPCYFQEDWLNEFYDMRQASPRHDAVSSAPAGLGATAVGRPSTSEDGGMSADQHGGLAWALTEAAYTVLQQPWNSLPSCVSMTYL